MNNSEKQTIKEFEKKESCTIEDMLNHDIVSTIDALTELGISESSIKEIVEKV